MTKRLVEIDDTVLGEAQQVLGTATIKDTVNEALRAATQASMRRAIDADALQRFSQASQDLNDPAVMTRAWE